MLQIEIVQKRKSYTSKYLQKILNIQCQSVPESRGYYAKGPITIMFRVGSRYNYQVLTSETKFVFFRNFRYIVWSLVI